jgi:polygalacturonase
VSTDPSTAHSNTDGCDPESCDHIVIKNCDLGAHDDNIAIKSGRDADGRRINVPTQNVVIFGCRMNGNWGAITCGSEQTGGIRNVYAYKCTTVGVTKFMLYVKSNTLRGGFSDNINLDSFSGTLDRSVVYVISDYNGQTGSFPPHFGPISITNTTCTHAGQAAINVSGLSNAHIHGLTIRDCAFNGVASTSNTLKYVDNLVIQNVSINGTQLGNVGSPSPSPTPGGVLYQAETATLSQAMVANNHTGFTGTGFVDYVNTPGGYIEWTVTAAQAGARTMTIRFANGTTTTRPLDISVNGATVVTGLAFPGTGAWTTWQTTTFNATLAAGTNMIRATATGADGGPNIDYLQVP